jgi:hypothetical protein
VARSHPIPTGCLGPTIRDALRSAGPSPSGELDDCHDTRPRLVLTSALLAAGFGAGTLLGVPGGAGAPGIRAEATQWLIDKRELGGLGTDTHGVDPGADVTFLTNTLLLADHRIHIENMAGLDQLPAKGAWVVVGGVRNAGGSGSAATVFGLIP